MKVLFERVEGYRDRPKALDALKTTLNHTKYMLRSMRNYSSAALDGDGPFTRVELETLEKLYNGECMFLLLSLSLPVCLQRVS